MKKKKFVLIFCLSVIFYGFGQSKQDTYFKDRTTKNLPIDSTLHTLGSCIVDIDKDGDNDIIIAVEHGKNKLYINDGSGQFSDIPNAFGKGEFDSEHLVVADFNADNQLDVIFIAEDDQQHQLFYGNKNGKFTDFSKNLGVKSEGNALAVHDFNLDGLPDILIGNSGEIRQGRKTRADKKNILLINDVNNPGSFIDESGKRLPGLEDDTQGFAIGDLDNDGDMDIVVANENPPNRILINKGKGVFNYNPNLLKYNIPLETREVHLSDIDLDGDLDLLMFNLTSNNKDWDKDPQIRLLINQGDASFEDQSTLRLPYNTFSVWSGIFLDVNQDGADDIIFAPIQVPGFIPLGFRCYVNNGEGYFMDKTEEYIPSESEGLGWGVSTGDVDGDNLNDIFIGGWGTQARLLTTKKEK